VGRRARQGNPPDDVQGIRAELEQILNATTYEGRRIGDAKHGIYAFYDFDGEPIYVGQTAEKLRVRVRRHLTNHRTDAVAMSVLDPFEVADIELWPFWELHGAPGALVRDTLNRAESTVFQALLAQSEFRAVLNEVQPAAAAPIDLPPSVRARIVPEILFERRKHSDIRIARRASTIARLAHIISERAVQPGLRQTLLTQARRLEHLARRRLQEVGGPPAPGEPGETTEEEPAGDGSDG
jgi:hypothetical protein